MVSYLYRMPAGIPGDVNRSQAATVETVNLTPFGTVGAPAAYGLASVIDATTGNLRTVISTDTAINGFLARPYPTTGGTSDGLGVSTPQTSGPGDLLRRGYMTVLLGGTTAATRYGAVNVWVAASTGAHVQGQVEAAVTVGSTIAIPAQFLAPADASGNVEISYNI